MTVNNVNALLTYATARADAAGGISEDGVKGNFEQVMSKLNGKVDSLQTEISAGTSLTGQTIAPVNTVKQDVVADRPETHETDQANGAGNTVGKETENTGLDAKEASDTTDTAAEEVERSGEKLIQDIADEMDVTPEEVEEAMAVLGLTAVELFDTDHLKQLLLALSGSTDELSLLTDESLYGSLQDLIGTVEESLQDLQEALGVSREELDALLKQMAAGQEETGAADTMFEQEAPDVNLEGMKDYTVSVQKDGETVQMKVTVDDASGNKSVQESVTNVSKAETQNDQKMQEKGASADSGKEGGAFMPTPETPVEISETTEPVNVEYRSMQTEEIMNQILEYMKINVKADTQTMELQLHPASLGTLNVQIIAKDGGLTAHFTTQNETVRAVIETQLIQLKNQFEEQGIKVDAVEVTVANHAYGQQFSQDGESERQDQAKAGKGRRRINLDRFEGEEDPEEMEDSERIAVEMMRANGNTVDYTV